MKAESLYGLFMMQWRAAFYVRAQACGETDLEELCLSKSAINGSLFLLSTRCNLALRVAEGTRGNWFKISVLLKTRYQDSNFTHFTPC